MPSEYVSSAEQQSGVVGRTTVADSPDEWIARNVRFAQEMGRGGGVVSTPGVPDTDALMNMAIQRKSELQDRRAGLTNQRSQLIDQLAHAPAGRRGAGQTKAIEARLHSLDLEEHVLNRQDQFIDLDTSHRISSAFRSASMTEKFAKDTLAHQTAQEAGEVFLKGTEIMGKYKPGTPEFHDAMVQLRNQYPLGFASEATKGHFGQIAKFHDQEMDRNIKSLQTTLFKNTGLSSDEFANIDPSTIRGTNVKIPKPGEPALTHEQIESGRKDTGSKGEKASKIAFDAGGQTFVMDKALFNNLSKHFRQEPVTQTAVVAQPQTEPVGMVSTQRGQPLRPITPQTRVASVQPATTQPVQNNLEAPRNPTERVAGSIYSTPKGNLRWTGTGWTNP